MVEINVWGVLVAAVASFACGALWYSPALFMKPWMRASGIEPDGHIAHPVRVFGLSFVFTLISAFALALLVGPRPPLDMAVLTGIVAGACIAAASLGINYQFANRGPTLFLVDGGFHVARFAVMGAVLGAWP